LNNDDPLEVSAPWEDEPPKRAKPRIATAKDAETQEDMPALMSEDYLAFKFTLRHEKNWRFVWKTRTWFQFEDGNWNETDQAVIDDLCIKFTRASQLWPEAQGLTPSERRKISQRRTAGAIRDIFSVSAKVRSTPEEWDANDWVLGTPGGTVDLKTGKLSPTLQSELITKRASVTPAAGPMPIFENLLEFVTCGDKSMKLYLQRWAGYCCTGSTREQSFAFLIGGGLNGKGTFMTCLKECLGDYARIMRDDTIMAQAQIQHTQELAVLDGLRLAFVDETDGSKRFNEARVKALTGGSPIVARKMRASDYEFPMRAKIVIAGNERPHLRGTGKAMARRMHIIPFLNSIPDEEKDLMLGEKLRPEYPAILAWMIEGCLVWQRDGLGNIEAVKEATKEYLESEDLLGNWIEENTVQTGDKTDSLALFKDFSAWCEQEGHNQWSRRAWGMAMMQRGIERMKSLGRMYYRNIGLKNPPSQKRGWND
jgi:putative DNA primase/helicase